jgi:hypothetical protein
MINNLNELTEEDFGDSGIIAAEALFGCSSLEKVQLPANINYIGEQAFEGCSLSNGVFYPGNKYNWRHNVFAYNNNKLRD